MIDVRLVLVNVLICVFFFQNVGLEIIANAGR